MFIFHESSKGARKDFRLNGMKVENAGGNDGGDCPDLVMGPNLKGPDGLLSAKRE
jgi:hypothetical protein